MGVDLRQDNGSRIEIKKANEEIIGNAKYYGNLCSRKKRISDGLGFAGSLSFKSKRKR